MKIPRRLNENEIMVKVVQCTESEVTLVLYTKPTIVTAMMDETFGADNWQADHTAIPKGNGQITMFCKISVYDEEKKRWISRDDAGEPVGSCSDKSQSTDALKRACALFGVGKELKTMPEPIICRTFVPTGEKLNGIQNTKTLINITKNPDGSLSCHDTFSIVQYLLDDNGNICALCIKDDTTHERVFTRDYRKDHQEKALTTPSSSASVIAPLASAELARYSLLKADTGIFKKRGNTLGELKPDELRWLFSNTECHDIKHGCLELAEALPEYKDCFLKGDINPDELLKNYR